MTKDPGIYEVVHTIFDGNYFDSFEEMIEYLDKKAISYGLNIEPTLQEILLNKANPTIQTIASEFYFAFRNGYKEVVDIYNLKFPFVISKKFHSTIEQIAKDLNLTSLQYTRVMKEITDYAADDWFEKASQRLQQRTKLDIDFAEAFKAEFEADISSLIRRYKKKYTTKTTQTFLELLELKILNGPLKEITKTYNEPLKSKEIMDAQDVIATFKRQKGRPNSKRYDKLLISLTKILTDDNQTYMPMLLHTLKVLSKADASLFDGFEINENSLRAKISKTKKNLDLNKIP